MKKNFVRVCRLLLSPSTFFAAALSISLFNVPNLMAEPCDCDTSAEKFLPEGGINPGKLCPNESGKPYLKFPVLADGYSDVKPPILPPAESEAYTHTGPLKLIKTIRGKDVMSPKSAAFHPGGTKLYVNALEAMKTLVFDASTFQYLHSIDHRFSASDKALFQNEEDYLDYSWYHAPSKGRRNIFGGKPVEMAFSHKGKYLWVTYYRRSYDQNASCPSAIAVIDTETDAIIRVLPTAPLPKMVVASPDGRYLAVIHWGDNSVGIYDISSSDPKSFSFKGLVYTGPRPDLSKVSSNRDAHCGQCVRGAAFTSDSKYLLVGRMHNGGISVIDMENMAHAGVFTGIPPTPRHMILSKDGKKLYVSSSASGVVSELDVESLISSVLDKTSYRGRQVHVGRQVRTITLSPEGSTIFAAVNGESRLVRIDAAAMTVTGKIAVPPYAVGVAVSTDGRIIVTTSQGKSGKGGHVLGLYTEDQISGQPESPKKNKSIR